MSKQQGASSGLRAYSGISNPWEVNPRALTIGRAWLYAGRARGSWPSQGAARRAACFDEEMERQRA